MNTPDPFRLAPPVAGLTPSATLAIGARAKALAAQGRDIVDLSLGEPGGQPPAWAVEAAHASLRAGEHRYAPVPGIEPLRTAIAQWYGRRHGEAVDPAQVLVTLGGKQALSLCMRAACSPGDEVMIPGPAWVSYGPQAELAGARAVIVPGDPARGFIPDPEAIAAAMTPRTRVLVLNSPSNPTGTVVPAAVLREIATIAAERGVLLLADEMYDALRYDGGVGPTLLSVAREVGAGCVATDAVSKTFAMTGWRVGWMVGPKPFVDACARVLGHEVSGLPWPAQRGAVAALTGPLDFLPGVVEGYRQRRDSLVGTLQAAPGVDVGLVPGGAFYLFPRVDRCFGRSTPSGRVLTSAMDVSAALLDDAGVAVVPGEAFGEGRCIRLSYATSLELVEAGAQRIVRWAQSLS